MLKTNVVFFDENGRWDLAGSESEAVKMGATYVVETLEELNDLSAAGLIVYDKIQTKEGIVQFYTEEEFDEFYGYEEITVAEYRLVS